MNIDLFGVETTVNNEPSSKKNADLIIDDKTVMNQEGLLPPNQSSFCFGHEAHEKKLVKLANEKRLPHSLIFSGLSGIGKATFAYQFARFLLTDPDADSFDTDTNNTSSKLISSGAHPDLLTIGRAFNEKKGVSQNNVTIDEIRKIMPFMHMTASFGGWRILIIDDADTMNRNAQNGILKILEEPPKNSIVILVCHRLGAFIPTIRSRCQVMHFSALPQNDFNRLLNHSALDIPSEDIGFLYQLTGGSVGQALSLIEEGGSQSIRAILDILSTAQQPAWKDIHQFAAGISKVSESSAYKLFRVITLWMLEQSLQAKAKGSELPDILKSSGHFDEIIKSKSLDDLIRAEKAIREIFEIGERSNLDKKQIVHEIFLALQ